MSTAVKLSSPFIIFAVFDVSILVTGLG